MPLAAKILSRVGEPAALLADLSAKKEAFDLIFMDADKPACLTVYKTLMDQGLLRVRVLLVVDTTMFKGEEIIGYLSENGKSAQALNQEQLADDCVS